MSPARKNESTSARKVVASLVLSLALVGLVILFVVLLQPGDSLRVDDGLETGSDAALSAMAGDGQSASKEAPAEDPADPRSTGGPPPPGRAPRRRAPAEWREG